MLITVARMLEQGDFVQAVEVAEAMSRPQHDVVLALVNPGHLLEQLLPQIGRVLKINELETITDDVIEAAASVLIIGK